MLPPLRGVVSVPAVAAGPDLLLLLQAVKNNGSLWGHALFARSGYSPNPEDASFERGSAFSRTFRKDPRPGVLSYVRQVAGVMAGFCSVECFHPELHTIESSSSVDARSWLVFNICVFTQTS